MTDTSLTHANTRQPFSLDLRAEPEWLLRLALASVFVFHGISKFLNLEAGAQMMGQPLLIWGLVAFAEIAGGLGILVGGAIAGRPGDAITRLSGLAIAPVMLGAIAMVHWGRWNFVATESHPMGGMEFQVVLLLMALFFLVKGNRRVDS